MLVEADPTEIGIERDNRLVPIPPALLPDKDRDFGPDENNAEIAKLSAKEGLAALQGANSATSDALLFSASLTLWHLKRFRSVKEAAVAVRKILSSGKAAERFNKAT
jgi:anthranilate phosphoribosyltransferase